MQQVDALSEFFRRLFSSDFMPHGHCFNWQPEILWLNVVSDALIALAYYSIPFGLIWIARRRPDLRPRKLLLMFAGFILACGTTHLISIFNLWNSAYRLEGVLKAITAGLSIVTALVVVRLLPAVSKLATPDHLDRMNKALIQEVEARKQAEERL